MALRFRGADYSDLKRIVTVHQACFKDYFLTSLGTTLLYRFYEQFLNENKDLFIVAESDDTIIGFVMGYLTGSKARQNFEKQNRFRLLFRVLWLCSILNHEALLRVRTKITALFYKRKKNTHSSIDPKEATLLSICILPDYQGGGRAAAMVSEFEKILLRNNKHVYVLSVKNYNARGVHFYEKLGFTTHRTTDTETTFIKYI